jgi:glycosyltransferase involved in cell wall biosynthesis
MKILLLMPQAPDPTAGGGCTRSFHFTQALASRHQVTAVILSEAADVEKNAWFEPAAAPPRFLHPPADFNLTARTAKQERSGFSRAIEALASPQRDHGKHLMIPGSGNCVFRAENNLLKPWHAVYARLLLRRAQSAWRGCKLFPSIALIYLENLEYLMPEIEKEHRLAPFDLIWYEFSYLHPLIELVKERLPNVPSVCNGHNNEWEFAQRAAENCALPIARQWLQLESDILRFWEGKMLQDSQRIYSCSRVDRDHLVQLDPSCADKVSVAPNGVDTEYFRPFEEVSSGKVPLVLFTGSADFGPNQQAAGLLVEEIMPRVRKECPGCRLRLAGRNARREWGSFRNDHDWVEVISDPPDMRPFFKDADVFAVPLHYGSGTRLKILEAMSMAKPIVSTSIGAEGIEAKAGVHFLLAEDNESMADAIVRLIDDASLRHSLAQQARRLVEDRYEWSNITAAALVALDEALATA